MKNRVFYFLLPILAPVCLGAAPAAPHGKAHHVVVMVWDGMRPDFVSEKTTPNLWKLTQGGVTFLHHHPVYTSSTEVNGTAMATGMYPEDSGVMANREYRPEVDPMQPVGTEAPATIAADVKANHAPYLTAPTVVQMLHEAGMRTAVAGSKGVALLQDWSHDGTSAAARDSVVLYEGKTAPGEALAEMTGTLGEWPVLVEFPNIPQDTWTTEALTQVLWNTGVPAYSVLWMSDPDYSQHQMAPGSEMALAAVKSVDDRLGTVLDALSKARVRDDTDVFVISDHGFSTVARGDDVVPPLSAAGLRVTGSSFTSPPEDGDVMAVQNGGSIMFYVTGHVEEVGRKLIAVIQKTDFAGVIFSRWKAAGTFDLHTAHIATKEAPDVVMALHWTADRNAYGAPGMVDGDSGRKKGKGTHASLSAYEMHNMLIAAGPDFRVGWQDETPTGNVDLAPTVLWILGVPQAQPMDGRVLLEAMPGHTLKRSVSQEVLRAQDTDNGWRQYLKVSHVGTTEYLDEGNRGTGE